MSEPRVRRLYHRRLLEGFRVAGRLDFDRDAVRAYAKQLGQPGLLGWE